MLNNFNTPILFLIFNRLDTTAKVFAEIKKIKPKYLFIAADGPRENKKGEKEKCEEVRKIVLDNIDWDCEVKTLFREKNLGCKYAVSSAIDWFFKNEEQGIILEDDCLPDLSFFGFCEELLKKYKNNKKIMMISGNNFQFGIKRGDSDYYFSKYNHIWGWATWKRAWLKYDLKMLGYPNFKKDEKIKSIWNNKKIQNYWLYIFDEVYNNKINTWDYQWTYAIWNNNGLCILPNINLVSNIGFGKGASHTKIYDKFSNIKTGKIKNISHPKFLNQDVKADEYFNKNLKNKNYKIKIILKKIGLFNFIKKICTYGLSYLRKQ